METKTVELVAVLGIHRGTWDEKTGQNAWNEPLYFVEVGGKHYRQVSHNMEYDYGYFGSIKSALHYMDYVKSVFQERGQTEPDFLLFEDLNPPAYWLKPYKGESYRYLLFEEIENYEETLEGWTYHRCRIERTEKAEVKTIKKQIRDLTFLIGRYNDYREKQRETWKRQREESEQKEAEATRKRWEIEAKLERENWEFASHSTPGKFYHVKFKRLNKESAQLHLSCDCPVWVFNRRKDRTCSHTDLVEGYGVPLTADEETAIKILDERKSKQSTQQSNR